MISKISLNPKSFKSFVKEINHLKIILGNLSKEVNKQEKKNYSSMRRKIVSSKNLKKGHKIKKKDFLIVRSQENGIFASSINKVIGKKLIKNINKFDNFSLEDFTQ